MRTHDFRIESQATALVPSSKGESTSDTSALDIGPDREPTKSPVCSNRSPVAAQSCDSVRSIEASVQVRNVLQARRDAVCYASTSSSNFERDAAPLTRHVRARCAGVSSTARRHVRRPQFPEPLPSFLERLRPIPPTSKEHVYVRPAGETPVFL